MVVAVCAVCAVFHRHQLVPPLSASGAYRRLRPLPLGLCASRYRARTSADTEPLGFTAMPSALAQARISLWLGPASASRPLALAGAGSRVVPGGSVLAGGGAGGRPRPGGKRAGLGVGC